MYADLHPPWITRCTHFAMNVLLLEIYRYNKSVSKLMNHLSWLALIAMQAD